MAITWGARVAANNYPRMGIELWFEPATVGSGTSQVTVYAAYYTDSLYAVSDNQTLNRTGTLTGTANYFNGGGQVHIGTWSTVVSTSFAGPQSLHFGAYQSGHYAGLSPSVDAYITIPQRPVYAPYAPPSAAVARVSDTQHTVSWTTNYTDTSGGYPWTGVRIYRSTDGGSYALVATVPWSTTSWSDTTTSPDHSYRYRVDSYNATGQTTGPLTSTVYTTPATPGTPVAVKSGSDIVLTFTNAALHDTGVKVYESQGGGAYSLLATVAVANQTTYTHVAPNASVTHTYKVTTYNGSLESAQSAASNTVQLQAAPNAPTLTGPSGVLDAAEAITFTWQHNPVDTTAQTAYEVQYRQSGGAWSAAITTGATNPSGNAWQRVVAGGTLVNDKTYEFQVRTKGAHADWSPWSSIGAFQTSARPTATITSPGASHTTSTVTAAWTYYDAESTAQAAWVAKLLTAAGLVLETKSGTGATASIAFDTTVADSGSYQVAVQVRDAAGLWSAEDTQAFTVSYALPPTPTLTAAWVEDVGAVVVMITNPAYEVGEADTDHNQVWRSIDSGPWVMIADGVPPNSAITDYLPVIGGVNEYRAVAFSALPSTAPSSSLVLPVTSTQGWVWLNAGPGFATMCRLRDNATLTTRASRAKTLNHFAGREYPVETAGQARTRTIGLSARIAPGSATITELEALADLPAPACYRDATGRRWFVSLGEVGSSHRGVVREVDIALTQVDHVE